MRASAVELKLRHHNNSRRHSKNGGVTLKRGGGIVVRLTNNRMLRRALNLANIFFSFFSLFHHSLFWIHFRSKEKLSGGDLSPPLPGPWSIFEI